MDPDEIFWIDNIETFDVIGDPVRIEILELLGKPRTVKQLAEAMEVPRTRLYHHIGLLVDAGVIRVVDRREVGALTERVYQVTAHCYQPSASFLAGVDPRRQAQMILDALFSTTRVDFIRAVEDGIISLEDRDGSPRVEVARRAMHLDDEGLNRFLDELNELFERYDDKDNPNAVPVAALHVVYPSSRRER